MIIMMKILLIIIVAVEVVAAAGVVVVVIEATRITKTTESNFIKSPFNETQIT